MFAKVVVDVKSSNVDIMFTYRIPQELEDYVFVGSRVFVEFGVRNIMGYVLEITEDCDYKGGVKDIIDVLDFSKEISFEQIELAKDIAKETRCLLTLAIELMYPAFFKNKYRKFISIKDLSKLDADVALLFEEKNKLLLTKEMLAMNPKIKTELAKGNLNLDCDIYYYGKKKYVKFFSLNPISNETFSKLSLPRQRIVQFLESKDEATIEELRDRIGCSSAIINDLAKKGILKVTEKYYIKEEDVLERKIIKNVSFTPDEKDVLDKFNNLKNKPFLFFSNDEDFKYKFYLEAVKDMIIQDKKTLIVTPTLMYNYHIYNYLKRNLEGFKILNFSSDLKTAEFYNNYMDVKTGNVNVVVTTKVGAFLPLDNIGTIIVIDEDNYNYLNEYTPKFNTIDVLKKRAKYHKAKLLLSSNTPSIEGYYNYTQAKYYLLKHLVNKEKNYDLVDMREELFNNNEIISSVLQRRIDETLSSGNQVMLILDSKGYSNSIMCKRCHKILKCPKCQISLTYYKETDEAKCRYCGRKYIDYKCECGSDDFTYKSIGLEMAKEKLEELYPDKNILLIDSDTVKNNEDYQSIVLKIESGEVDIILGTSNIITLTKYSSVKLISLLCADNLLAFSDYRASYNTYNLISKAVSSCRTVIQGYNLSHHSIVSGVNCDYVGFFNEEITIRKDLNYSPFININKLIITGEYKEMYHAANYIKKVADIILGATCLGPTYDKVKRGVQLIIKHNDYEKLYRVLDETEKKFSKSNIMFSFERNPRSF